MNDIGTVIDAPASTEIVSDKLDLLGSYVEALFDSARVMMHVVDRDFNIVKVNRRWLQVMEYDEAEVLGHDPAQFLTDESRQRAISDVIPLFVRVGSDRGVVVDLMTKNGRVLSYLLDSEASFDSTGIVHGFAAIYDPHNPAERADASSIIEIFRQLIIMRSQVKNGLDQQKSQSDSACTMLVDGARFGVHSEQPAGRDDARLTGSELDVLRPLASGDRNGDIAKRLSVSVNTVKFHIENIYQKLGVQNRTQAARVAAKRGLLDI